MKAANRIPLVIAMPLLSGILVASLACEPPGPASDWSTARETPPSGAVLVTNTPSADASPTLMLVEELRVGSLDGARPESFAALKGLVALPGGGFAVLDSQAQEIRVFGADGSHVATHGRPGEGPGEFVDATGLMLDPRGRIWAADPRGARMSVFDPVDGFLESFRYQYMVRGFIWTGIMTDRGHILKPSMSREDFRPMLRVYDSTMTQIDSIFSAEEDEGGRPDPEDSPGAFYFETPGGGYGLMDSLLSGRHLAHGSQRRDLVRNDGRPGLPHRKVRTRRGHDPDCRHRTATRSRHSGGARFGDRRNPGESQGIGCHERDGLVPNPRREAGAGIHLHLGGGNVWVAIPNLSGGTDYDVLSGDGSYLGTVTAGSLDVYPLAAAGRRGGHVPGGGKRRAGRALRRPCEDCAGGVRPGLTLGSLRPNGQVCASRTVSGSPRAASSCVDRSDAGSAFCAGGLAVGTGPGSTGRGRYDGHRK